MRIIISVVLAVLINFSVAKEAFAFVPLKGLGIWLPSGSLTAKVNELNLTWFYSWGIAKNLVNDVENNSGVRNISHFLGGLFSKTDTQLEDLIKEIVYNPLDPAHARHGLYWLVGNEPDLSTEPSDGSFVAHTSNDDIDAHALALQYTRAVNIIKRYDNKAKIIFGGFVRFNLHNTASFTMAQRLMNEWQTITGHPLKNDIVGWHIHYYGCCNYGLRQNRDFAFESRIALWKDWQNTNFPGTETWLTELGPGLSLGPVDQNDSPPYDHWIPTMMQATIRFMEINQSTNLRIDRYAWFPALSSWTPWKGPLLDAGGNLTTLGQQYASIANPPFYQLQTANRIFWYGSYPKDPTSLPLSNCKTISQKKFSRWANFVNNYTPLPPALLSTETYYLSCLP